MKLTERRKSAINAVAKMNKFYNPSESEMFKVKRASTKKKKEQFESVPMVTVRGKRVAEKSPAEPTTKKTARARKEEPKKSGSATTKKTAVADEQEPKKTARGKK